MSTEAATMTGAESLARTLGRCGVDICFTNPGTTEMHLVHGIDATPDMRSVLCLFEGVCTGAADAFARMTGRPASTLLHLGAGLGNGVANLHNARRARSPMVNLVGNHASYHLQYDAPLTSDIDTLARAFSCWHKSDSTAQSLASDGADAVTAALTPHPGSTGQIATLIVGTDAAWGEVSDVAAPNPEPIRKQVSTRDVDQVAQSLDSDSVLIIDGPGLSQSGVVAAARIAARTGCKVRTIFAVPRLDIGAGRPAIKKIPYFPEHVQHVLKGTKKMVLAGAEPPVSFFAYPHSPGQLIPEGCEVLRLAQVEEDVVGALEAVSDAVGASTDGFDTSDLKENNVDGLPGDAITTAAAGAIIANRVPEGCIIAADSGGGNNAFDFLLTARPCTWMSLTGGAIGSGGPAAVGAAVACPDRRVLTLQGDGGAMYTNQAFWTQAREGLDVTTVIFSNREYWILEFEYLRLGLPPLSPEGESLFSLEEPSIDWVAMAASMGVPGCRVQTIEELDAALDRSFSEPGPYLIEAEVPSPRPSDLTGLIPKRP